MLAVCVALSGFYKATQCKILYKSLIKLASKMQVFDPERRGPTKEDPQCYSKGILVYALNFVSEQLLTWKLLLSKSARSRLGTGLSLGTM